MPISIIDSTYVEGFKNAHYDQYMAIAEIIDNSIQANAKNIHIVGIHENLLMESGRQLARLNALLVYDDGDGMSKKIAEKCLVYGGGTRHGAKKNLGKFGMGLPSASGSQCDKTEVYTWQKSNIVYKSVLDFEALSKKNPPEYDDVEELNKLPTPLFNMIKNIIISGNYAKFSKNHGTVVFWQDCKRFRHKTYKTFYTSFEKVVGRIYRHIINKNGINISLTGFRKSGDAYVLMQEFETYKKIRANDPLFLMENNLIEDVDRNYAKQATNKVYSKEDSLKINNKKYNIKQTFTIAIDGLRSSLGGTKNAGSQPLGKLYAEHFGISLVRSNRELKLANFKFIDATNAPEHRWWSAEIAFEPEMDEIFGVTFDKQEARNFRKIDAKEYSDAIEEDDEALIIMHELTNIISGNITSMMKELKIRAKGSRTSKKTKCPECEEIAIENNKCNKCNYILEFCLKHDDQPLDNKGICGICISDPPVPVEICTLHFQPLIKGECKNCNEDRGRSGVILSKDEEKRLRLHLENNYPNYKDNVFLLDQAINHYKTVSLNQIYIYTNNGPFNFIDHETFGQITIISVNMDHPFYERYMEEVIESEKKSLSDLSHIHLIIGALIKAERDNETPDVIENYRGTFGLNLKKLMKLYHFEESS